MSELIISLIRLNASLKDKINKIIQSSYYKNRSFFKKIVLYVYFCYNNIKGGRDETYT